MSRKRNTYTTAHAKERAARIMKMIVVDNMPTKKIAAAEGCGKSVIDKYIRDLDLPKPNPPQSRECTECGRRFTTAAFFERHRIVKRQPKRRCKTLEELHATGFVESKRGWLIRWKPQKSLDTSNSTSSSESQELRQ